MTSKSLFSIEQYEERLQKLAHEFPKFKSVTAQCGNDDIRIDFGYTDGGELRRIVVRGATRTGKIQKWMDLEWEEKDYWGLTIESKHYVDSPHTTKILGEDKKALEWLEKLMADITPSSRFRLSEYKVEA